jgi:serine/threonine protein phosphatase 1
MISKLLGRQRAPLQQDATIPEEMRVYAIGDIHGRLDLLERLLADIDADNTRRGPAQTQIIFLGDLIDRGPASAQVVELARQLDARGNYRFLLGNHEEVFLQALSGDGKALAFLTRIGGRETILSYGITENEYRHAGYDELLAMLAARVPPEHIAFLKRFEDLIVIGDYAFVHAGVRPGRALAEQKIKDLRWIRGDFLDYRGQLEKVIVHGHTVADEVEQHPHRIGLDTGAFASDVLTAMGFEGGERWVLQARL